MKKIIPFLLLITLAGCGKKEWSKEYMASKCSKELKNNSMLKSRLSADNINEICDCVGEKMMEEYKSEAAANKDLARVTEISKDCTMEVLMPNQ